MSLRFTFLRVSAVLATLVVFVANGSDAVAQGLGAPSELTARASAPGDLAISLFWIDNALGEDGFEIQRSTGVDSMDFESIGFTLNNVGSYNDIGLAENTTYNYRVRAYKGTEFSEFSGVASAKTSYARPNQVTGLQGELNGGIVALIWGDASDNETRFEVERAEVGVSTEFTTIATLNPDSTMYVDDTPLDGAVYSYRVRPWRFDVAGGAPEVVTITMGPGIAPPTSVRARATMKGAIALSWRGKFATGTLIQIQRFNLETGLWSTIAQVDASKSRFTDSGLTSQTTYIYRLRAVTTTAVSPWESAIATAR